MRKTIKYKKLNKSYKNKVGGNKKCQTKCQRKYLKEIQKNVKNNKKINRTKKFFSYFGVNIDDKMINEEAKKILNSNEIMSDPVFKECVKRC
jgi:hypothetical protein